MPTGINDGLNQAFRAGAETSGAITVELWLHTAKHSDQTLAVRESSVSWHYGGPIEGTLKFLGPLKRYHFDGFQEDPYLDPIILFLP